MNTRVMPLLDELVVDLFAQHREVCFRLTGRCMEPAFQEGSVVCARSAALVEPQVGDAVLVRMDGHLKVHRLLGRRGDRVQTRPDVGAWDPPVDRSEVLGVLEGRRPRVFGRHGLRRVKAFALLRGWLSHG